MSVFGGLNVSDQPNTMILRAFSPVDGGYIQHSPVESPNAENVDFLERALGKRLGSAELDDYSSVLISGDTILRATAWIPPGGTAEVEVAAGAKGIYSNQSGSWARLNNANGTAFQWNTDSTKISFVMMDNHLIIMSDKNYSQVYRSGTALDNQMHNDATATTVDVTSNSGQAVFTSLSSPGISRPHRLSTSSKGMSPTASLKSVA